MLFVTKEGWVGPYLTYIIPGAHSCQIIIARGEEKWGKKLHADTYIKWKRNSRHRQNWSVRDVHSEKKIKRRLPSIYLAASLYTYIVLSSILYRKLCPADVDIGVCTRFLNAIWNVWNHLDLIAVIYGIVYIYIM